MSNKETLQNYNSRLAENNTDLATILETVNNLPEAGGTEEVIDTYSTEETVTNKVWIDGKPIYRKVINATQSLTSGSNAVAHGISNFGVATEVKLLIFFNGMTYVNSSYESATNWLSLNRVTSDSVYIFVGSGWGSSFTQGFAVILEYTKTTD